MKRPIKKDYLTTLPLQCEGSLIDYYKQLEKYVDSLEQQLNLHIVSGSFAAAIKEFQKGMNDSYKAEDTKYYMATVAMKLMRFLKENDR